MKKKTVTMIIFLLLSVLISLSKSYAINISEQYHMKEHI